jgi:hypothetical protein
MSVDFYAEFLWLSGAGSASPPLGLAGAWLSRLEAGRPGAVVQGFGKDQHTRAAVEARRRARGRRPRKKTADLTVQETADLTVQENSGLDGPVGSS